MREAIHQDEIKLQQTLEQLKQKGYLEYTGEYGAELTTFIPFVAWLNQEGILKQESDSNEDLPQEGVFQEDLPQEEDCVQEHCRQEASRQVEKGTLVYV